MKSLYMFSLISALTVCMAGCCGQRSCPASDETGDIEKIESSAIEGLTYDKASQTLTIVYPGGGKYEYAGVPEEIYTGLKKAESKGAYLTKEIKGKFKAKKL